MLMVPWSSSCVCRQKANGNAWLCQRHGAQPEWFPRDGLKLKINQRSWSSGMGWIILLIKGTPHSSDQQFLLLFLPKHYFCHGNLFKGAAASRAFSLLIYFECCLMFISLSNWPFTFSLGFKTISGFPLSLEWCWRAHLCIPVCLCCSSCSMGALRSLQLPAQLFPPPSLAGTSNAHEQVVRGETQTFMHSL